MPRKEGRSITNWQFEEGKVRNRRREEEEEKGSGREGGAGDGKEKV